MAEINTVIAEASQDLQTIENFVNLPAGSDVFPRLLPSVNVGTLAGTRDAIFEAGGLPATPFATKTLMTASVLVDGKYAQVTDDTVNNGLYVKTAGAWVKSAYDPLGKALAYTDKINASIFSDGIINIPVTPIIGYAINVDTPAVSKFSSAYRETRSYLQVDLGGCKTLSVRSSIAPSQWRWVFRDKDDVYISMTPVGVINADFDVPANAKWAYRTFEVTDAGALESPSLSIKTVLKNTVVSTSTNVFDVKSAALKSDLILKHDTDLYGGKNDSLPVVHISGAVADTSPTTPTFLATGTGERKHIVVNVKDYSQLTVSGDTRPTGSSLWYWVLELADGSKQVTNKSGNTTVVLPPNTIRAYRSTYYKLDDLIIDGTSSSLTITATPKNKRIQPQIDELSSRVGVVEESVGGGASNGKQSIEQMQAKMTAMFERGDFISPNDFADATQMGRIKSAIAFAKLQGYGIIELATDTVLSTDIWTLTEAVLLPSNCWIYINNSTVKKAAGVFDNMFRNDGIVLDANPFNYATALNENTNIRIFGNDKLLSKLIGNIDNPYIAPHPVSGGEAIPWTTDLFGFKTIGVLFANTKGHQVYNLSVSKVTAWSFSNEHGCSGFKYHDLDFDTAIKNGDGVNVRMGCSDFEIYNISGKTSDDMVAINTINSFIIQHPSNQYVYPMQVGGYTDRGFGVDIKDGKVSNISGKNSNGGVLVLFTGGGKISNVSISNVSDDGGAFSLYMVLVLAGGSYGSPASLGDAKNITINGVKSVNSDTVVRLEAPLQDSWINNINQQKVSAKQAVAKSADYVEDNVKITNIKQV